MTTTSELSLAQQNLPHGHWPAEGRVRRGVRPRDHRAVHRGQPRPAPRRRQDHHLHRDLRRAVHPRPSESPRQGRRQDHHRLAVCALPLRPQCRPLPDGRRLAAPPRRRARRRLLRRVEPASEVNGAAIDAMAEVGIDIRTEFPKPWTDEIVQAADVVVTMGCGDACPLYPGKRYEDWELTTRPASTSPPCGPSATRSAAASSTSWASWASQPAESLQPCAWWSVRLGGDAADPGAGHHVAVQRQPQSQQVPSSRRVAIVLVGGPGVQDRAVGQQLDVTGPEVHVQV